MLCTPGTSLMQLSLPCTLKIANPGKCSDQVTFKGPESGLSWGKEHGTSLLPAHLEGLTHLSQLYI